MKAREFIEQTQQPDVMQVVPTPFSVEGVKGEFMKKQAEFEYTGITVSDVKFAPEGTMLTLQQEANVATVTFSYADDVGPFAAVKPGQSQGESVNLDLTPLSPPVVETSVGKQVDVGNMSWMTVEAFEGIVSAAGMKPVEVDPSAPPDNLGSQGSGASTPTSELPQQQKAELDAKQVPAPTPRGGFPGESLYSDGKPRYYPGIKVKAIDEIGKKNEIIDVSQEEMVKCDDCDFIASETEFERDIHDILKCPECGSMNTRDVPKKEEAMKEEEENKKLLGYAGGFVYYQMGDKVYRGDYADEHPRLSFYSDIKDFKTQLYDEGGNPVGVSEKSLYTDGTSKYHPGLKQEAIHRVTWSKGKDIFVTDVEAGSEKEASKKVKDSVRADKIISTGKQVKENLRGEHKLKIISLHDGQAECSAGDWSLSQTGVTTKEGIQSEFNKHLKNIPESKSLTYFRFVIREGERIKIPVGKVSIKEDVHSDELPPGYEVQQLGSVRSDVGKDRANNFDLYGPDGEWIGEYPGKKAAIRKSWSVQRAKDKATHEDHGAYNNGEEETCPVCYGRGDKDCPRCKGKGTVVLENKIKKATEFLKRFGK